MKNFNIKPITRKMSFGELSVIALGEYGRGRKETIIPCAGSITPDTMVDIGTTKSGGIKIIPSESKEGWLANISSQGCYTRGTLGNVYVPPKMQENVEVLASGYGAYGDAGRIGNWYQYLVKIKDNTFIFVRPSGGPSKIARYYLYFAKEKVHRIGLEELDIFCETMGVEKPPVEIDNLKSL